MAARILFVRRREDFVRITTTASSIADVEQITKALGRLNEHFRHKMP
ncbi:hypothetical protein GGE12_000038 [Rhizobium mongolense]|uniref:Uncharacterized protein n=1 Tax=Rhizobium mongolense TaxID=57676 RepID=A0A7W6RHZ2_9HYPH|nr:hypothetical protein [Rhizobium mongolense]